jgi:hypothetical protein
MPTLDQFSTESAFATFDAQDSECLSYGVEVDGDRWFVKTPRTPGAGASMARVVCLHAAVRHPAIVRPAYVFDGYLLNGLNGPTVVYPWHDGSVLNSATLRGADRSALQRFQALPLVRRLGALDVILDAHLAISAAGYVPVDLYDGCFLYDFERHEMHLIDLDEYRPGPFVLASERLPGSSRFMAPEEFVRGSPIDERTAIHALGRTLSILLDSPDGNLATPGRRVVIDRATQPSPDDRYASVAALAAAWREAS